MSIWKGLLALVIIMLVGCGTKVELEVPTTASEKQTAPTTSKSITSQGTTTTTMVTTEERTTTMDSILVFEIETISDSLATAMMGKSYQDNPYVQLSDLRCVQTGYVGFDGQAHQGMIIVNKVIAEDTLAIFKELYEAGFPIERMEPMYKYDGDDILSMTANNTSAFNYRVVDGTNKLSRHAYGLAIDINPLINPWVTSTGVSPEEGTVYADRTMNQQGMLREEDVCVKAFKARGFTWGGNWNSSKDYQHFDVRPEDVLK